GDHSSPYIPRSVYGMRAGVPLVITEGPIKALVLTQAGVAAAGLRGVWCSDKKTDDGKLTLSTELRELGPRGLMSISALTPTPPTTSTSVMPRSGRTFS